MRNRMVAFAAVALVVIGGGYMLSKGKAPAAATNAAYMREVSVSSVADLSGNTSPLPLVGEVQSVSEADIRAESAGSVTSLSRRLGDYVAAGGIIAQLENSSERAAVLSAQGSLGAAQANLDKVANGTRSEQLDISQSTNAKAQTTLIETKNSTVDSIKGVYGTNDDVIRSKLDVVFSNPRSNFPKFNMVTTNQSIVSKIEQDRIGIEVMLNTEAGRAAGLSTDSDIHAELTKAIADTRVLKTFVDDVSAALNIAIATQSTSQSTISGYIVIASAARASLNASLASLSASAQALTAAETAASVAAKQLEQDKTGSRTEDTSSAKAGVMQAQGSYNAALANLEKTIIRSPISGTINNLSIKMGDFVTSFQQVAVVSNNGSLEIVASVTVDDRATIAVGNAVSIEGKYAGIVTRIAPAIDPITKKIEVRIGIPKAIQNITNGQSVHIDISRSQSKIEQATTPRIPISAIKIESTRSIVFTLSDTNTLIAHEVKTGDVVGNTIEVTSGVTADMRIVTDARGLKEGQEVKIK